MFSSAWLEVDDVLEAQERLQDSLTFSNKDLTELVKTIADRGGYSSKNRDQE